MKKFTLDRRAFLLTSTGALLLPSERVFAKGAGLPDEGFLAPLDTEAHPFKYAPAKAAQFVVVTDTVNATVRYLPGLKGCHSVLVHPTDLDTLVLMPKHQNKALTLSLRAGKVVGEFSTSDNFNFYGHGLFSPDGKYLYTSESSYDAKEGRIAIREAKSWKIIAEKPSFGRNPHELRWASDGATLVVANAGPLDYVTSRDGKEVSNLVFVDVKAWKMVRRLLPEPEDAKVAHFALTANGEYIVGTVPGTDKGKNAGMVLFSDGKKDLTPLPIDGNTKMMLFDEVLSVAVSDDSKSAAATFPHAGRTLVWQLGTNAPPIVYAWPHPTGLAYMPKLKGFVAGVMEGELRAFTAENEIKDFGDKLSGGNTTHMTRIVGGKPS